MKFLIYDDEEEEWRYVQFSFWSLFKIFFLLGLAQGAIALVILMVLSAMLSI